MLPTYYFYGEPRTNYRQLRAKIAWQQHIDEKKESLPPALLRDLKTRAILHLIQEKIDG